MKIIKCSRCNNTVTRKPKLVTKGYYAYCPHCYEDMFSFEVYKK